MTAGPRSTKAELKRLEQDKAQLELREKKLNDQEQKMRARKLQLDKLEKELATKEKTMKIEEKKLNEAQLKSDKDNVKLLTPQNSNNSMGSRRIKELEQELKEKSSKSDYYAKIARKLKTITDSQALRIKILERKARNSHTRSKSDLQRQTLLRHMKKENSDLKKRLRALFKELSKQKAWYTTVIRDFKVRQSEWVKVQQDVLKDRNVMIRYVFADDVKKCYLYRNKWNDQFLPHIRVVNSHGGHHYIRGVNVEYADHWRHGNAGKPSKAANKMPRNASPNDTNPRAQRPQTATKTKDKNKRENANRNANKKPPVGKDEKDRSKGRGKDKDGNDIVDDNNDDDDDVEVEDEEQGKAKDTSKQGKPKNTETTDPNAVKKQAKSPVGDNNGGGSGGSGSGNENENSGDNNNNNNNNNGDGNENAAAATAAAATAAEEEEDTEMDEIEKYLIQLFGDMEKKYASEIEKSGVDGMNLDVVSDNDEEEEEEDDEEKEEIEQEEQSNRLDMEATVAVEELTLKEDLEKEKEKEWWKEEGMGDMESMLTDLNKDIAEHVDENDNKAMRKELQDRCNDLFQLLAILNTAVSTDNNKDNNNNDNKDNNNNENKDNNNNENKDNNNNNNENNGNNDKNNEDSNNAIGSKCDELVQKVQERQSIFAPAVLERRLSVKLDENGVKIENVNESPSKRDQQQQQNYGDLFLNLCNLLSKDKKQLNALIFALDKELQGRFQDLKEFNGVYFNIDNARADGNNANNLVHLVSSVQSRHLSIQQEMRELESQLADSPSFLHFAHLLEVQNTLWSEAVVRSSSSYDQWRIIQQTLIQKLTKLVSLIADSPMTQMPIFDSSAEQQKAIQDNEQKAIQDNEQKNIQDDHEEQKDIQDHEEQKDNVPNDDNNST